MPLEQRALVVDADVVHVVEGEQPVDGTADLGDRRQAHERKHVRVQNRPPRYSVRSGEPV
jgi:hypothetical protein